MKATSLLCFAAVLVCGAQESFRVVSGARYVTAGADGAVYVLSDKRDPTAGAWMERCEYLTDSLTKLDARTGAVLWSTCLPVRAENLSVDARGAVTIAGSIPLFVSIAATPGAYGAASGPGAIAVIRLHASGTAPEWVAVLDRDPRYSFSNLPARVAIGPDGSVYGVATRPPAAYFFRLSGDGAKLLHESYLRDVGECRASALAVDDEGNVFAGGSCDSFWLGFNPSMATPGTFTTERSMWVDAAWVARFDPVASAFRYISVFGQVAENQISLTGASGGRVAIAGVMAAGVLSNTPGALTMERSPSGREAFLLVLNPAGTAADVSASFGVASVRSLHRDGEGSFVVSGQRVLDAGYYPGVSVVPTSVDAWRPVNSVPNDSSFLLKLNAGGTRLVYATGLDCPSCTIHGATGVGDVIWVATANPSAALQIGPAYPVTIPTAERSILRALPDHFPETRQPIPVAVLYWDTRDAAVRSAEVRRDSPVGPVVGRGTSGAVALENTSAQYFLVDAGGRTLATETFTRYTPLSGTPSYAGYRISLQPNPVLTCLEAPSTGTDVRVSGSASDWVEVRVGAPSGPVLTAGPGRVDARTGDWVRNGMPFFLSTLQFGPHGSVRAYLLPNRSCVREAPPEPMIRTTRDCTEPTRFTLAWWTGSGPVEIREGRADGSKVARFADVSGLFDVTATSVKEFVLMAWRDGAWRHVATTTADPLAPCEQGAR